MTTARSGTQLAKPQPVTPEEVAQWEKMLDDGMSYREIRRTSGRGHSTIAKYLPGRGWSQDEGRALGTFMKHHNERMRKVAASYV